MALDRLDAFTVVAMVGLVGLSTQLPRPFLAAMLAGLCCTLAIWRLYDGRPWETLAWVVWTVSAVGLVVVPPGPITTVVVLALILVGTGVLVAGRLSILPDVWTRPDGT